MQTAFPFSQHMALPIILERMERAYGRSVPERRDALRQLVYMLVAEGLASAVATATFNRIMARYQNWPALAAAPVPELTRMFVGVPGPDRRAARIGAVLTAIFEERGAYDVDHLDGMSVEAARRWLEGLPGVGDVMATAVLTFSSLSKPVLPVSRPVARTIRRLGLCAPAAPLSAVGREVVEAAPAVWGAEEIGRLGAALSRTARNVCHAGRPDCAACPLAVVCPTANAGSGEVVAFPSTKGRKSADAHRRAG